ncbi:hypothetical protein [Siphonobacter curvatus]|uniref:Uncharacterized protein n=1 Tax=Siphonobacter curvatus TaxID=2094562 RepID=A0A2S7INE2_9BACT|nr:hypothetical protein [Siphonobacter curvatus]PQA59176.1 hypothetical protein C5O19_05835 [Siphonobacter curvatus]
MVQAEALHREAAILSNTLHTYPAEAVEAVKPVIQAIIDKRMAWKQVRQKAEYLKKFGELPPEAEQKPGVTELVAVDSSLAELQVQLQRLNVNITKYEKKVKDQPEHKKAGNWAADLDKMRALKRELQQKIVNQKYEKQ